MTGNTERDALAQALCRIETRSRAVSLAEVQAGIQRWTRHRYEAERLLGELRDDGWILSAVPERENGYEKREPVEQTGECDDGESTYYPETDEWSCDKPGCDAVWPGQRKSLDDPWPLVPAEREPVVVDDAMVQAWVDAIRSGRKGERVVIRYDALAELIAAVLSEREPVVDDAMVERCASVEQDDAIARIKEWRGWYATGEAPSPSEWAELDRRIAALTPDGQEAKDG